MWAAGFIEYVDTQQASAQMLLRWFNRKKLSFHDRHLFYVDDYVVVVKLQSKCRDGVNITHIIFLLQHIVS